MQNKYPKLFIIMIALAIVVPQIALAVWWNPFSWGMWNRVFHFQRTEQKQQQTVCTMDAKQCPDGSYVSREGPKCEFKDCPKIIGGDKDAHGCLGSAGYTWCETKQKCLRSWEESCNITVKEIKIVAPIAVSNINLDAGYIDAKILSQNKAVRVKILKETVFTSTCYPPGKGVDNFYNLNKKWDGPSWWFTVKGTESNDQSIIFANEISCISQ